MNASGESRNCWVLKSKGVESAFAGNEGYDDDISSHYTYDTTVKNHDKILENDLIIITSKRYIEGFGRIERIHVVQDISKNRYRCPICNTQDHYERKGKSPKYRCWNKHEFDDPIVENVIVNQSTAFYNTTFIPAPPKTSTSLLEGYYIKRNLRYSIQAARVDSLENEFPLTLQRLLLKPLSTSSRSQVPIDLTDYLPSSFDSRITKVVSVITRQRQQQFREKLFQIYGIKCMLSGCQVPQAIEASHICPYRGEKDNHARNGLLLRRDLHAIFDANLIGIHPETLMVYIHPSIKQTEYRTFEGKTIQLHETSYKPSKNALEIRWNIFNDYCAKLK